MPTNANTFNSRVTSEALEKKFRDVFPAQGGAELVQDLFASGVIQPVIDFSSVAEGSVLSQNLQTAWDFATGSQSVTAATYQTVISNPGFWKVDLNAHIIIGSSSAGTAAVDIYDGATSKPVWAFTNGITSNAFDSMASNEFIVFLRSGDVLRAKAQFAGFPVDIWYRQIADVNGNLVNPLGFVFT